MTRISRLSAKAPKKDFNLIETGVVVLCRYCNEQNDKPAMFDTNKRILMWECPNGHKDFIEDWNLV